MKKIISALLILFAFTLSEAAIARVGTSVVVNTSANSGSQSITVPTCTFALLQWYGLGIGTNSMDAMTLDAVSGTLIGQTPGTSGSFGGGGFYVKSPAAGSKTFAWDFNGTSGFNEGGVLVISFFTGVELTGDPIRDWGSASAIETADLTDVLTTASDDFVHIGAASYDVSANTAVTGQTTDETVTPYDHAYVDIAHVDSPGASTTTCAANGSFYGGAFFVALKNSGGGGGGSSSNAGRASLLGVGG